MSSPFDEWIKFGKLPLCRAREGESARGKGTDGAWERGVIRHVPPPFVKTNNRSKTMKWIQHNRRNVINHTPTIDANKINKTHVLSMHTADICQRVIVWWQKTLIFGIRWKILIIRAVGVFDADKNRNQFQELPLLDAKTYVSCRWNRRFLHQEPPFFEIKSTEWSAFLLWSVLEDVALCHADLANRCF